jgi:uncharacterized protein YjbJ (UPF0337 family)
MFRPVRPPDNDSRREFLVSMTRKIARNAATAKGAATKTAVRLTGNRHLQARGRRAQAKGKLRQAAATIRNAFSR